MSRPQIAHSPDLQRLRNEGYHIEVRHGHLLVHDVPYVDSNRQVRRGTFVSVLDLAGDRTVAPRSHVAYFIGEQPCHRNGAEIEGIKNSSGGRQLAPGLAVDRTFSNKPASGRYADYYEKVTSYVIHISGPAQSLDPEATAQTYPLLPPDEDDDSPFVYADTASSRAGIGAITPKLALARVAIVGLGGTGSYVFDLVAKTPVREIHLFDGDKLSQHNAFRAPGAPTTAELEAQPYKVAHLAEVYSAMRRGIVPHPHYLGPDNADELDGMDFAFLCIDKGTAKEPIVTQLERAGIPFVDVGMGVMVEDGALYGVLRVTTSEEGMRGHVRDKHRISFDDGEAEDPYAQNIQIADLNAMNAALAVIRWKKMFGFYRDLEGEHFSLYTIDGNHLANDDRNGPN